MTLRNTEVASPEYGKWLVLVALQPRYYIRVSIQCEVEYKRMQKEGRLQVRERLRFSVMCLCAKLFLLPYLSPGIPLAAGILNYPRCCPSAWELETSHQERTITFATLCRYFFLVTVITIGLLWIKYQHIFYDVSFQIYLAWQAVKLSCQDQIKIIWWSQNVHLFFQVVSYSYWIWQVIK